MSKVAIVYYSGTGNTASMASAVENGAKNAGADVSTFSADGFTADTAAEFDAIAFGCPAMGAEQLEEGSFEPMFMSVETSLGSKKVGLFGSYGWGDGTWMRNWEDRCRQDGINLVSDGVICNDAPDAGAIAECEALGASLAK